MMEGHKVKAINLLASSREKKQKASGKCKSLSKYSQQQQQQPQPMDCCESMQVPYLSPNKLAIQLDHKHKIKHCKLLSSKSLSQLVPRGLFFKKPKDGNDGKKSNEATGTTKLTTTKSFPNYAFHPDPDVTIQDNVDAEFIVNRVNSVSLIGFPRQSTSNVFGCSSFDNTLEGISLSPIIIGSQEKKEQNFGSTTPSKDVSFTTTDDNSNSSKNNNPHNRNENNKAEENLEDSADNGKKRAISGKLKALKNTKLVLRDVKNSIGLRIKAKQESQAFAKLTNELATPPTKLYSPFNIYTPDNNKKDKTNESKCKRMLQLNKSGISGSSSSKITTRSCSSSQASMIGGNPMVIENKQTKTTPKQRIALQHKKHLMQANKFTFDSPTGKFRETVKDVEQFQQCIEDISQAIRSKAARESSTRQLQSRNRH